jgi:hypothetical protein
MYSCFISITGPTRCTICFQFITINSLYMFWALICSSSGGTVYTAIGIFSAYYVSWLLAVWFTVRGDCEVRIDCVLLWCRRVRRLVNQGQWRCLNRAYGPRVPSS